MIQAEKQLVGVTGVLNGLLYFKGMVIRYIWR